MIVLHNVMRNCLIKIESRSTIEMDEYHGWSIRMSFRDSSGRKIRYRAYLYRREDEKNGLPLRPLPR